MTLGITSKDDLPVATATSEPAIPHYPAWPRGPGGIGEVLRVAVPLMISTGCLSAVLFADRTLLLRLDGASMSASMAGGNLFWTLICLPLGIASMTGAFVAQYVGAGRPQQVGKLLWQAIFLSLTTVPFLLLAGVYARELFIWTGQANELLDLESIYFRVLLLGALGGIIEAALSGFFSGTHRAMAVMWINIAAALLNLVLDIPFIFGFGPIPSMGIAGAAVASVLSFWFKAFAYALLLWRPSVRKHYHIAEGCVWNGKLAKRLLFYGLPAGLQYLTEAGAFTFIVLQIGQLGSMPLQATTMAINFNMIAFVPLMGVSIAASVLVGQHLTRSGPSIAMRAALTSLAIGMLYSCAWAVVYLGAPNWLMSLYRFAKPDGIDGVADGSLSGDATDQAIDTAIILLRFVAAYVIFDSAQLILGGVLRGAGDTWYVLAATSTGSLLALGIGLWLEPAENGLMYWWFVIMGWVWLLSVLMTARFLKGSWKNKRLVEQDESILLVDD